MCVLSLSVQSSYFVGATGVFGKKAFCFILSADVNHRGGRGMTPASYMYILTIYRYDKLLNV